MGIENREYLRDEESEGGRGGLQLPTSSTLVRLIIATVVVFLLQLISTRSGGTSTVTEWLSLSAEDLYRRGQIWRLLSYAFCHSVKDPLHLIFNMMTLYFAGNVLQRMIGQREFGWFYCASAIFSGMMAVVYYAITRQPTVLVGASGAVCAVFGLVVMHYPRQKVLLFGGMPIELRWLLVIFMLLPVAIEAATGQAVSHAAHFGGLLFGFLYFRSHMQIGRWWDQFAGRISTKRRAKGKLRIFAPPTSTDSNASLDAQVDPILEKISREGEASLTARERNILIQASRKLKKDRDP